MSEETAVPTIMGIVQDEGGSGSPKTIVEALQLLREEIAQQPSDPLSNAEIDAITEGGDNA